MSGDVRPSTNDGPDHDVVVIGAGISRLGVAWGLLEARVDDFVVLERADDIGGTWRDHTYPGIGVDVPAFAYQYSYHLKPDWSRVFAEGDEIKTYLDDFVETYELREHIRFGVEITTRTWDETNHMWRLRTRVGEEITARFVVSALGADNERRGKRIPGVESFEGKLLDPTAWDHDYVLAGKHVAVIGTGATAAQIVPAIVTTVARLEVYQRTPNWVLPKVNPKLPRALRWLLRRNPKWNLASYNAAMAIIDFAEMRRQQRVFEVVGRAMLLLSVRDRHLRRRLTPDYPFGAERPTVSNSYLSTFNRDNVELITDGIAVFTANGLRTETGCERSVDAVIMATGYRMAHDPGACDETTVTNRGGFNLRTRVAQGRLTGDEGFTVPGLPNYFTMSFGYGAVGGSRPLAVETMTRQVVRLIEEARRRGATSFEVTMNEYAFTALPD